jgi:hypothetical protein
VDAELPGAFDLIEDDGGADPLAVMVGVDIDGVLDGEAVAGLVAEGVEGAEAEDGRLEAGGWRLGG